MSSGGSVAAVRRLEALFSDVKLDAQPSNHARMQNRLERKGCDVHGNGTLKMNGYGARRGSLGNILHHRRESVGPRRESMPALNSSSPTHRRKECLSLPISPPRKDYLEHPSAFPSTLRKDSLGSSVGCLRRDPICVPLHRDTLGSTGSLRKDSVGSRKDSLAALNHGRRDSYARRRFSTDSLDGVRRNSWDPGRRGSSGSSGGWDDPIWEENVINKVNYFLFVIVFVWGM